MSKRPETGKALIVGGSIGGLFAAATLLRDGWEVSVCERVDVELAGRGAGIVTHESLLNAFESIGVSTKDLGVAVSDRVAFDFEGNIVNRLPYPQVVTSWDRIHTSLRALIPEESYRTGCSVASFSETRHKVTAQFKDGTQEEADLLIGADGFRSAIRAQMQPKVKPEYAGYVVWRAVTPEAALPPEVHARMFAEFGFFAPNGTQIVGYPIAGPDNDLRPGHRQYNFVWYSSVSDEVLRNMLTDVEGTYHSISIPPPLVRDSVRWQMEAEAVKRLPADFVEIIRQSGRPFFTPIYDHCSPKFASGRVALLGDAACNARPHVGMGVTKSAEDSLALARHLSQAPVAQALTGYSAERVPASRRAYEQARRLGSYIFDVDQTVNLEGRDNPMIDTIMAQTAAPVT